MKVPFVDLKLQAKTIRDEVQTEINNILDNTHFILGTNVTEFEKEFAAYCGAEYAVGLASGTDALLLALEALHIGPGDEVITAANTFIATAAAIHDTGARPVFVDIDRESYNLDVSLLKAKLNKKTRAIIQYGWVCGEETTGKFSNRKSTTLTSLRRTSFPPAALCSSFPLEQRVRNNTIFFMMKVKNHPRNILTM